MKSLFTLIAILVLLFGVAQTLVAQDDPYPYLDADIYFHALFVHQENFHPGTGVFGSSMTSDTGMFNSEVSDNDFNQLLESRFRFFLNAHMHEQVKAAFTLEINPEYGREQGFGDFRTNNGESGTGELRIKHFYVETNHPLCGTLGYRIGRQSFSTPGSLIVGDPDAEGMTLWYKNKKAGAFTLAAAAADTSETHEIEDIYTHFKYDIPVPTTWMGASIYASALVVRDLTAGPFNAPPEINRGGKSGISEFLLGPSDTQTASGSRANLYWTGLLINRTTGDFNTEFNAIVNFGQLGQHEDYDTKLTDALGYLASFDASWGQGFYRLGVAGAFVSGHNPDPEARTYSGYLDIDADFTFTRFFFDGGPYLVSTGFASPSVQGSGLMAAKVYLYTNPTYWLSINLQAAALSAATDRPRPATDPLGYRDYAQDAGRYYGSELNFWIEFTPVSRVNWLLEFDFFAPGSYFKGTATDDDPGNLFLKSPDPAYRLATGFLFR